VGLEAGRQLACRLEVGLGGGVALHRYAVLAFLEQSPGLSGAELLGGRS
jgi:hypothetical protein